LTEPPAPWPLQSSAVVDALAADLRSAGYTNDGVTDLLGADASAAFSSGLWWSALRAIDRAVPDQQRLAVLVRLFLLGGDETRDRLALALPTAGVEALVTNGVVEATSRGTVRAALDIRPHSDGARDCLVVSDLDAAMRPGPVHHDHVLGIGGSSVSLAHAVVRTPVGRALDLGTGCGIQALHLNAHCDAVVATDTNERALALAAATARLNGMSWDLRHGSLFEPVAGERFDLIVSNPPFVVGAGTLDYLYRDSGMAGDALCRTVIEQIGDHLEPGGTAQIMANWIVRDGRDWRERVAGWLAGMRGRCSASSPARSTTYRCSHPTPASRRRRRHGAAGAGWTGSTKRASKGSGWG
jgi:Methyltransferase small domain